MTLPATPELDAHVSQMFLEVLRRTHLSAPHDLAPIFAQEARRIGITTLVIYLTDYEQQTLVPVPAPDAAGLEPLSVEGTVAGRAFTDTRIIDIAIEPGHGRRLWVPLLDGTERIGVLCATIPGAEPASRSLTAACERYAHFIAVMVVSKSAYTDYFETLRRTSTMTLASELLLQLVPPRVLASDDFVLSAMLEPCYDIGGDAYDYAFNQRVLHVAVFDAMGHGLAAAGMVSLALSAYRHSRRAGHTPAETYAAIDAALLDHGLSSRFTTAVMAELDLDSGHLRWVSAGHPAPLLLRDGRLVKALEVTPAPPLGLGLGVHTAVEGHEALEPGDMILLYTDGLTEARRPGGELFSVERLGQFIEREASSGHGAPEALRRLREAIIVRGAGALHDDASAVLVEWRRGTERALLPETVEDR